MTSQIMNMQTILDNDADRPRLTAYYSQHIAGKIYILFNLLEKLNRTPRRCGRDELPVSDDCVGVL